MYDIYCNYSNNLCTTSQITSGVEIFVKIISYLFYQNKLKMD